MRQIKGSQTKSVLLESGAEVKINAQGQIWVYTIEGPVIHLRLTTVNEE